MRWVSWVLERTCMNLLISRQKFIKEREISSRAKILLNQFLSAPRVSEALSETCSLKLSVVVFSDISLGNDGLANSSRLSF
jgi:hypothetical protein